MNVTLMERLDFQLFFDVITVAINALLHALWHFSCTLVIELSRHIMQLQGSIRTAGKLSHMPSSSISCSTFAIVLAKTEGLPESCSSWTSVCPYMNSLTHFCMFVTSQTVAHRLCITDDECQWKQNLVYYLTEIGFLHYLIVLFAG